MRGCCTNPYGGFLLQADVRQGRVGVATPQAERLPGEIKGHGMRSGRRIIWVTGGWKRYHRYERFWGRISVGWTER